MMNTLAFLPIMIIIVAIGIPVYIIQKIVIPFLETAKVLIPITLIIIIIELAIVVLVALILEKLRSK